MAYYACLTALGRSKLAAAAANNTPLAITTMLLGDGNGLPVDEPTGEETHLVNPVYSAPVASLTVAGAQFTAMMVVPSNEGGWTVREMGLQDADGDLVAYANTPNIEKPTDANGVVIDFRPTLTVNIDAPGSVQVIVDPAIVSASQSWVDSGYLSRGRNLADVADKTAARANLGAGAADGLATLNGDGKVPLAQLPMGTANGLASLDGDGKLPSSQLPSLAVADTFVAADEQAMLALSQADKGDMCVRTDLGATFVLSSNSPENLADWIQIQVPASVSSVAGKTGAVTLTHADVGLGNVDNTADADKPVSTAQAQADANTLSSAKNYTDQVKDALTNADVGLGNVDNTADADKPVSTAQAQADAAVLDAANNRALQAEFNALQAVTTHSNNNAPHNAASSAAPNRLMLRDGNGRSSVAAPTASTHAANKEYVDSVILPWPNGYKLFPGGFLVQWCMVSSFSNVQSAVTAKFARKFSICFGLLATLQHNNYVTGSIGTYAKISSDNQTFTVAKDPNDQSPAKSTPVFVVGIGAV